MGDPARVLGPQGGVRIATGWRVHPFPPGTALPLDGETSSAVLNLEVVSPGIVPSYDRLEEIARESQEAVS